MWLGLICFPPPSYWVIISAYEIILTLLPLFCLCVFVFLFKCEHLLPPLVLWLARMKAWVFILICMRTFASPACDYREWKRGFLFLFACEHLLPPLVTTANESVGKSSFRKCKSQNKTKVHFVLIFNLQKRIKKMQKSK